MTQWGDAAPTPLPTGAVGTLNCSVLAVSATLDSPTDSVYVPACSASFMSSP